MVLGTRTLSFQVLYGQFANKININLTSRFQNNLDNRHCTNYSPTYNVIH